VHQLLIALTLGANVAAWWFAIHVLGGRRFIELGWLPIAIAAFGIPVMIADTLHGTG